MVYEGFVDDEEHLYEVYKLLNLQTLQLRILLWYGRSTGTLMAKGLDKVLKYLILRKRLF